MALETTQVHIIIVWIDMLTSDDPGAAENAASLFEAYPQVVQFHDPNRNLGAAVAASIGAPEQIAWDMYLFYNSNSHWGEEAPPPYDWAHQLRQDEWADPSKFHWGEKLRTALRSKMNKLLDQSASA